MTPSRGGTPGFADRARLTRERMLRSTWREAHRQRRYARYCINRNRAHARKHLGRGRTVVFIKSAHEGNANELRLGV